VFAYLDQARQNDGTVQVIAQNLTQFNLEVEERGSNVQGVTDPVIERYLEVKALENSRILD
jgi:hypothetical protein